ncbi:hypothetical protein MPTK1_8g13950 [Marchantia polymorpha subsp. ruderalis]|uniref:Uncharacterized protein n=1 Tax=Marchantia polymorpha TaxID=3197 RepID=A0A2R6WCU1_MARPO|nr:hypothetical protein MARPO_0108s0019 [Marchantia polymorpha]BBN19823.1 hypothetical protein Mp_8g13950 [Marchantia polymorpha subsp. ruderalis]|eukprot:PTQ31671.1 hypothetical protein MARPO_0108s0019 [Marchantia polymorpha]
MGCSEPRTTSAIASWHLYAVHCAPKFCGRCPPAPARPRPSPCGASFGARDPTAVSTTTQPLKTSISPLLSEDEVPTTELAELMGLSDGLAGLTVGDNRFLTASLNEEDRFFKSLF